MISNVGKITDTKIDLLKTVAQTRKHTANDGRHTHTQQKHSFKKNKIYTFYFQTVHFRTVKHTHRKYNTVSTRNGKIIMFYIPSDI